MKIKKRNLSLQADLSLLALLVLTYVGVLFLAFDAGNLALNSIVLTVAAVVLIVTYFTSLAVGLVATLVMLLILLAYMLFTHLPTGVTPPITLLFWYFWMPLTTLSLWSFTHRTQSLQAENLAMHRQFTHYSTIDVPTGLKNLRAFDEDAALYMDVAQRTELRLLLAVLTLEDQEQLHGVLREASLHETVIQISHALRGGLGTPHALYLVGEHPFRWACLRLIDQGTEAAERDALTAASEQALLDLPVALRMTAYPYDGEAMSPFALLDAGRDGAETGRMGRFAHPAQGQPKNPAKGGGMT